MHLVLRLRAIATWEAAGPLDPADLPSSPGERILLDADPNALLARSPLAPSEVDAIVAGARGPKPPQWAAGALGGFFTERPGMLSGPQCAALSHHVESCFAVFCAAHPDGGACCQFFEGHSNPNPVAMDFKLAISEEELDGLLGRGGAAGAVAALGAGLLPRLGLDRAAASVRFILRRRAAVKAPSAAAVRCDIAGGAAGSPSAAETPESQSMTVRTNRQSEEQQGEQQLPRERIPFHRDASLVVVSVALNKGFEGAQLLFALDGRVHCPACPVGCATAHDCATVHGVSCMASGTRYTLFAVFERREVSGAA